MIAIRSCSITKSAIRCNSSREKTRPVGLWGELTSRTLAFGVAFLFPLVLLNSPDLFTVPLLLSSFRGQFGSINYGLVMAASAMATIPMLIAFVIGQRRILNSMAASGLGGR